ncbi:hypothetical protein K1T71_005361 [Dendrolimus kikuchii]|uniref:Uncharacterized protein n=1 Tax=Dendrolimus kikuchii TaxID=765133 RepID=A0ACC1D410_9NEOP|nr:hypothetical protein K1T71_005361 [Dendrolimus kikuchii]
MSLDIHGHDTLTIKVGEDVLKQVDKFRYLGNTVTSKCDLDAEINSRARFSCQNCIRIRRYMFDLPKSLASNKVLNVPIRGWTARLMVSQMTAKKSHFPTSANSLEFSKFKEVMYSE